jgi:hypothetical protein
LPELERDPKAQRPLLELEELERLAAYDAALRAEALELGGSRGAPVHDRLR